MEEKVVEVVCPVDDGKGGQRLKKLYYLVTRDPVSKLVRYQLAPHQAFFEEGETLSNLRAVALGGGTGLPIVLKALSLLVFGEERNSPGPGTPVTFSGSGNVTGVVAVSDDGGSSGALRRQFGILPPGDIRNCLLSLSQDHGLLADIFSYRFNGTGELNGHTLGNLVITALTDLQGSFLKAVETCSHLLGIRGQVFPATMADVTLKAELWDGREIVGESQIARAGGRIRRIALEPAYSEPFPEVVREIGRAGVIIVGPGSLYTSLITDLLVNGIRDALLSSGALKVLIANVMTEPGETDGYTLSDHIRAFEDHGLRGAFDLVVLNNGPIDEGMLARYRAEGAEPVKVSLEEISRAGLGWVEADLLAGPPKIRHDPVKLCRCLSMLLRQKGIGLEPGG